MPEITPERYYKEECFNALTHGIGIVLAVCFSPLLLENALEKGASARLLWGTGLFCLSMILLYAVSTLYHCVHHPGRKRHCRKMDHIAIYLLIAGTHTPFILRYLDNAKGWLYLGVLWSLLLVGTFGKVFFLERWERLSLVLYLFMGWMFVFVLPDVLPLMRREVLIWIGVGAFFYTSGVFFFVREKMWYSHAIWHVFVLAGTAGHYVALWYALEH
ncbi:MAG: hemolysin III family protein [Saprospiraceae bacterium]